MLNMYRYFTVIYMNIVRLPVVYLQTTKSVTIPNTDPHSDEGDVAQFCEIS